MIPEKPLNLTFHGQLKTSVLKLARRFQYHDRGGEYHSTMQHFVIQISCQFVFLSMISFRNNLDILHLQPISVFTVSINKQNTRVVVDPTLSVFHLSKCARLSQNKHFSLSKFIATNQFLLIIHPAWFDIFMCFFSDLHSASSIRISDVSESTLTRSKFKVDDKPPSLPRVSQLELGEHCSESTTKSEQIPLSFESMSFNTVLRNVMYFIASLRISCLESFLSGG